MKNVKIRRCSPNERTGAAMPGDLPPTASPNDTKRELLARQRADSRRMRPR